VYITRVR